MSIGTILARTFSALLLIIGTSVVTVAAGPAAPALAARACHKKSDPIGYSLIKTHYPVVLHGIEIALYSGGTTGAAFAEGWLDEGDVISIDRANFTISGDADHYWFTTTQVQARGTYDYCESRAPNTTKWSTPSIDGAHRPVRACLRHNGVLACSKWWYADNDD